MEMYRLGVEGNYKWLLGDVGVKYMIVFCNVCDDV